MKPLNRRDFLSALAGGAALASALAWPARAAASGTGRLRLAATWRGPAAGSTNEVGMIEIDLEEQRARVLWSAPLPGRAHGLADAQDGSLLVVAVRPGGWMLRFNRAGQLIAQLDMQAEQGRHLSGHVAPGADGDWLYTTETDPRTDEGWVSVRRGDTLAKVAEWRSAGIEPHQLLRDATGQLLVANGGILRAPGDRKRDLYRMSSSLVRLDPLRGELLGQWRVEDPRLSLRHLAWSTDDNGVVRLGVAMQAEHDDPLRQREGPVLAVWEGAGLTVPTRAADAEGYGGDIAAAPGGGFVVSSNRSNKALLWHPARPDQLQIVASLTEAYALGSWHRQDADAGVAIAAARGIGLWNPRRPAVMIAWPGPMVLDNHWIVVG